LEKAFVFAEKFRDAGFPLVRFAQVPLRLRVELVDVIADAVYLFRRLANCRRKGSLGYHASGRFHHTLEGRIPRFLQFILRGSVALHQAQLIYKVR
jgi:hypothetical protein